MTRDDLKHGLWFALKLLAISVLFFELFYVAAANALLMTGLLKRIAHRGDTVAIDYDSAWTILPGRVHVTNVSVHAQDTSIQWVAEMDRGVLDVSLAELPSQRLHLTRLRGRGFVFRVRSRVPPEALDQARIAAYPPIPGYATAEKSREPPQPEPTDADYHLWTVHLEGVDAELRELWIQEYRYIGSMLVRGVFYYKPLRRLEVGPAEFDIAQGEIRVAERTVVGSIEGGARATVEPFDPRGLDRGALRHFSGHAWTSAQIAGLEFTSLYLTEQTKLRLADGSGSFRSDMSLERGVVTPASRLEYHTSRLDVRHPSLSASLAGDLVWFGEQPTGPPSARGRLQTSIAHATLYRKRASGTPPSADGVRLEMATPVDLAGPLSPGATSLDVAALHVPDLHWLESQGAPSDALDVVGGSAVASVRVAIDDDGKLSGKANGRVEDAAVTWKGIRIGGKASADVDLLGGDVAARSARLRSTIALRDVALERDGDSMTGWWGTLTAESVDLQSGGDRVDAVLAARCRDARLVTGLLVARDALPGWLSGLFDAEGATARARLKRRDGVLDLTLLHAEGDGTQAAGRVVRRSSNDLRGAFVVKKGPASAGVSFGFEGSGIKLLAGNDWLREQMPKLAADPTSP